MLIFSPRHPLMTAIPQSHIRSTIACMCTCEHTRAFGFRRRLYFPPLPCTRFTRGTEKMLCEWSRFTDILDDVTGGRKNIRGSQHFFLAFLYRLLRLATKRNLWWLLSRCSGFNFVFCDAVWIIAVCWHSSCQAGGSIFWILASLALDLAIFGALLLQSRPELPSEQYFSEWRRAPKISLSLPASKRLYMWEPSSVIIFTSSFSESPLCSHGGTW